MLTGAVIAKNVRFDDGVIVNVDSFFANQAPVAQAQSIDTLDAMIDITLSCADPESENLRFATGPGPSAGALTPLTPIVPPLVAPRDSGVNCNVNPEDCTQGPVSSATVKYTPTTPGGEDAFTFTCTDPHEAAGMAVVSINGPPDNSPPPPTVEAVDACPALPAPLVNCTADVVEGGALGIGLDAAGPPASTLTFCILSLPAGTLTDSAGADVESFPYTLPSSSLVYAAAGAAGTNDSFDIEVRDTGACGDPSCSSPNCDQATFNLSIVAPLKLAEDSSASTPINQPVSFELSGNPGGGAGGAPPKTAPTVISAKAVTSDGAEVAGNVSDATGDGNGDGRDNLPGPAPVLVAAGVDVNLGAGTSGSVSDPDNDASPSGSSSPDPDPDVVSASVSTDGTNLFLEVRYKAGTFDSALTRAQFLLDTNQDPNTGHPGTTAGCPTPADTGIIGSEFIVDLGGDVNGTNARVNSYAGTCNAFTFVGNGTVTFVTDGMDATVPLALIGGDNDGMNFKVTISEQINLGSGGSTGVLDTMPDTGLPPGQVLGGVKGIARVQIEWDVANLGASVPNATVLLTTQKGTVDDLNTVFFAGTADQDGILAVSDFQAPASVLPGVIMPVPAGPTGTEGTFSIGVTDALNAALAAGLDYFSIQARVDESLAGFGFRRGLQIRSTASGNLVSGKEPKLVIDGGVPAPVLTWTITSVPATGTLRDAFGATVTVGTSFTSRPTLVYTSPVEGSFEVKYRVDEGLTTAFATVFISVVGDGCALVGREPGCAPGS